MSTGKDYGLPAEYADWVEVLVAPEDPGSEYVEIGSRHHRVASVAFLNTTQVGRQRYFVPPKPKPTLPKVGPGTVLDFKETYGMRCRAVRGYTSWTVFGSGGRVGNGSGSYEWSNEELLGYINGEYTVVLEGLA